MNHDPWKDQPAWAVALGKAIVADIAAGRIDRLVYAPPREYHHHRVIRGDTATVIIIDHGDSA